MRAKCHDNPREEGNAMIMGGIGLIIVIMIMAMMMDLGMYYNSYRRLKAVSDFANEEIQQMLPYYAYADDYDEAFRRSLDVALDGFGYTADNVVRSEINRSTTLNMSWVIEVSIDIELMDEYHCMFASFIGIDTLPLHVAFTTVQPMSIDQPYFDGNPYEVWGEEDETS